MTLRIIACMVIAVCFAVTGTTLAVALVKLLELSKGWPWGIMVGVFMGGIGTVVANYLLFR